VTLPSTTDIFDFPGLEAVADFAFTISVNDFVLQYFALLFYRVFTVKNNILALLTYTRNIVVSNFMMQYLILFQ